VRDYDIAAVIPAVVDRFAEVFDLTRADDAAMDVRG
jgi:hypothetical protein